MKKKWTVILAAIPLMVAVLAILLGLNRLSMPDPQQSVIYLGYSADETNGWSFETENGAAQPRLADEGYFMGIAAGDSGPVAASRVMEDTRSRNLLEFGYYGAGIQVFLDDQLLYTDFPNMDNRADAFLTDVNISETGQETLHISLPYDHAGKTLRVVSYAELWEGCRPVIFPSLLNRFSDAAIMSADIVWDIAAVSALAILSVLLLLMFLLGERTGQSKWKLLPLAAYFLLSAIPLIQRSYISDAAGLGGMKPALDFASLIYIDFLVLFLGILMKGWRRWTLLAACAAHLLLSVSRVLWEFPNYADGFLQDPAGLLLVILSVLLMLFSWKEHRIFRSSAICVLAAVAVMFMLWVLSRMEYAALWQLGNPVNALLAGDPRAFYRIICVVISLLCACGVIVEFIRDYVVRQKEQQMLLIRSRMAQESYEQAVDSIRQTSAMRHEWKNQVATFLLLQKQGKQEELQKYLLEMDTALEHLAAQHYCNHFAVNTILQSVASRAKEMEVHFDALAQLPDELKIADGDLCSLLMNMLDNALEAAAQCAGAREIHCAIRVKQGYLAIKCENSYSGILKLDERDQLMTTKSDAKIHGFGISQMKAIAEKYGSILDVSYTGDRFTVQTALKID